MPLRTLLRSLIVFLFLGTAGLPATAGWAEHQQDAPGEQPPLIPLTLQHFPPGAIRPSGWLADQLSIQANGLSGHLDEFWPDIRDSGWIGGDAEGWERAPYWLDGVVPLAFLLDDEVLKGKVKRYIDYSLEHQDEDGWLGPRKSARGNYQERDPWPVFVMMKVLTQWQEATGDDRVIPALSRFLRRLDEQLDKRPLFEWNRMRWQDGVLSVYWLYERTGEDWLLELADQMAHQGYDWTGHFSDLPHLDKVEKWEHESHVVNNAMGIKAPAVRFRRSRLPSDLESAREAAFVLDRYHGQASGLFSGDECFAGKMPSQGTETCAVVEYLFSLEKSIEAMGRTTDGDRLERIAFNALPAPFKPDMWARQYVQQANQAVARVSQERIYTTNGPEANLYGLETNYGCCTANMHQGWPKFANHLWMKTADEGLAAVAYAPSRLSTSLRGQEVSVRLETEYPFDELLQLTVETSEPVRFPLLLRIPRWAEEATIQVADGTVHKVRPGGFHRVSRLWAQTTRITLRLPMPLRVERRFNDAVTINRGPLVFSLAVGESWRLHAGEEPHADWEILPSTSWNYALELNPEDPAGAVVFERRAMGSNPFTSEGAPVIARVKGRLLPEWTLEKNAAAPPPPSPVTSDQDLEELILVPYGAAKLRITEFPTLK